MCGIVGTLNLTQNHPIRRETLSAMLGTIRHRGPDQFGVYCFQDERHGVGLGSARLSIIDLGGGQQPIGNEDGTLWIVFNGEIFNHVELRPFLQQQGHRFRTDSDTEVILHLYETYGPDCLRHLNGQFSFAIWDERSRTLFVARDRLGIRPFFYTVRQGALIFGSEVKALLADERVTAAFDPLALGQIFTTWAPLGNRTPFQDIYSLPPGHWLQVDADGAIQIEPYWRPEFPVERARQVGMNSDSVNGTTAQLSRPYGGKLDEAAAELRRLLIDATQLRLRADVPVGAYLSGGLDSSTIAALIRRYTDRHLETFSIAFSDDAFDESGYQQQMAAHLGTHHNLITCTHADIGRAFPNVIWHTEAPILRTSPVPLYLLSRLVQQNNFKVVLTGEGADEFLGGYNIFKEAKIRRFWARQPRSESRPLLLHKLYGYVGNLNNPAYLRKFFGHNLQETDNPLYSHALRWRNTARSWRIFSPDLRAGMTQELSQMVDLPADFGRWSPLAQAQFLEITVFMAGYLLSSQGDRVAMAHSVEGRFPFLDHRVIEFANRLPPHFKLRGLDEKHILKHAVRDLLPEMIWQRPKRPYRAPIHRSFFPDGQPLDWVAETLSPAQLRQSGLFNEAAVAALQKKLDRFGTLGETDDMTLAGLLSTQLIYHHFIAHKRPAAPLTAQDDVKEILKHDVQPAANQIV